MNSRTIMEPQDISALGDTDIWQSVWLGSWDQDPPDTATSTAQQQKPPSASPHVVMVKIDGALTDIYHRASSQPHLAEQPKGQGWPRPYAVTLPDSSVHVLVVGAMIGLAQRLSYGVDWPKATTSVSNQEMLVDMLRELFHRANYEVFEDGMDSDFSNNLNRTIRDFGVAAISALERMISADHVNPEVAAEALIWVGRMDDEATQHTRLTMLERALESSNVCIRDAASIGIGAMDDPAAISSLRRAIDREQCGLLRQNLKDTLEQLKDGR